MEGKRNLADLSETKCTAASAISVEIMEEGSFQQSASHVEVGTNFPTKKIKLCGNGTEKNVKIRCGNPSKSAPFPPEILEKIFENVKDPKDVLAVVNASPQFSEILTREKTTQLFNQVFPVLFSALDRKEILTCRFVCKQWKQSVDNFLQTQPRQRIMEPYPTDTSPGARHLPLYYPIVQNNLITRNFIGLVLPNKDVIKSMTAAMDKHPGNPFVLRDVYLEDSGSTTYWSHAFRFLVRFGEHIWHLHLFTEDMRDQPFYFFHYKMLRRVLQLTPNVRTLSICGFHSNMDTTSDEEGDQEQRLNLHRYISRHPLPKLEHLHTILELVSGDFYRQPIMKALISSYSNQLRKLIFPMSWVEILPSSNHLHQINELDIQLNDGELNWRNSISSLDAPNLAKLKLNVWVPWEISTLLEPFQHNFPSLVYLQVSIRRKPIVVNRVEGASRFRLERVKTLEVLDSPYVNYDQLLNHLSGLEYFMVCYEPTRGNVSLNDNNWQIRKWMYSNSVYESNLWSKMPSLKEFIFAKLGNSGDTENDIVSSKWYYRGVYNAKKGNIIN